MKNANRITTLFLSLIMTVGMFSCAKEEPEQTNPETQNNTEETTETTESTESEPAETEPAFTLDMEDFTMQSPTDKLTLYKDSMTSRTIPAAVEIFKEKYPDVEVEVITYPDDEYEEILKTELAAGGGPDLFYSSVNDLPDIYKSISSGIFLNLDQLISRDEEFSLDNDYVSGVIDAGMLNGRRYFIPISYAPHQMLTTEEALAAEGLTVEELSTFDGFYSAIEAYQEKYAGDDTKTVIYDNSSNPNLSRMMNYICNSGIPIIDYENNTVGIADNPEAKAAFRQIMDSLRATYDPKGEENENFGWPDVKVLENGECLFIDSELFCGVDIFFFIDYWRDLLKDGYHPVAVHVPDINDGVSADIYDIIAIPKSSKNQVNAYRLLKILLSEEIQFSGDVLDYIVIGTPVLRSAIPKRIERDSNRYDGLDPAQFPILTEYAEMASAGYVLPRTVWRYVRGEMYPYIDGSKTYEECYDSLVNILTLYKDE